MFTKPTLGSTANYPQQVGRLIDIVEGPARRNFIRNGDFQIAQRGASIAGITAAQYTLDGVSFGGSAGTNTFSQQPFTVGQTDVPGNPANFLRIQRTVAAGATNLVCSFPIEMPARLSGKTVTLSFYARVASGSKQFTVDIVSAGVTPTVDTTGFVPTITTAWQLFTVTETIPAMSAATASAYIFPRFLEGSPFQTFTLDIADIQLEIGSEATAFERLEYFEQFLWAQRFLPSIANDPVSPATQLLSSGGVCLSASRALIAVAFFVPARARPTGIVASAAAHFACLTNAGVPTAATGIAYSGAQRNAGMLDLTGMAGLVQGNGTMMIANNNSALLYFTGAEL